MGVLDEVINGLRAALLYMQFLRHTLDSQLTGPRGQDNFHFVLHGRRHRCLKERRSQLGRIRRVRVHHYDHQFVSHEFLLNTGAMSASCFGQIISAPCFPKLSRYSITGGGQEPASSQGYSLVSKSKFEAFKIGMEFILEFRMLQRILNSRLQVAEFVTAIVTFSDELIGQHLLVG